MRLGIWWQPAVLDGEQAASLAEIFVEVVDASLL